MGFILIFLGGGMVRRGENFTSVQCDIFMFGLGLGFCLFMGSFSRFFCVFCLLFFLVELGYLHILQCFNPYSSFVIAFGT